ncbi:UNVERIFIED_CONTAM: hypothetical protein GTU68_006936 [Idotea baltica]|nr:hypothetical protein [Idotea baltica]
MQAIINNSYGAPQEVMELQDVDIPTPDEDEILIEIHATAINDYDWSMARGRPFLYRLLFGINKPKNRIAGMELSGIVRSIGSNVEKWKIDDHVYGDLSDFGFGSFAEYICINQNAVCQKPEEMSFEEAAALPHAALLAWQALGENGISKHQNILVNGAGGGVGTNALHLAKMHGVTTTGVDSAHKGPYLKSIGYDHVIDYRESDFTKNGMQYDLILDCKSSRSAFTIMRSLSPEGTYVTIGGKISTLIGLLFWGKIFSLFSKKRIRVHSLRPNDGLDKISALFKEGKIRPTIDGPYALKEVPRLVEYFGAGEHRGKVVIKL